MESKIIFLSYCFKMDTTLRSNFTNLFRIKLYKYLRLSEDLTISDFFLIRNLDLANDNTDLINHEYDLCFDLITR